MELKTVQTQKIYKSIVEQIVGLIQNGALKTGDRLPPERQLAEMLDVSRTSVREALKVMEIMGVVDIRPGEGSIVSGFKAEPFLSMIWPIILADQDTEKDLLEFRKILEEGTVRNLAIRNKGKEFYSSLELILADMENSFDNLQESVRLDILFHRQLFQLTGNKLLIEAQNIVEYVLEKTVNFTRTRAFSTSGTMEEIFRQHKVIYEALVEGDCDEAIKRMSYHLDYVFECS